MLLIVIAAGAAFLLSSLCMPWAERFARSRGLTTKPAAHKTDQRRLPYLGGVAMFFVLLASVGAACGMRGCGGFSLRELVLFLAAAGWTMLFGLYDDVRELPPVGKFVAQMVSAGIIVASGIRTEICFLSPALNMLVSAAWIMALMNAINLLDIMDGLAGGITLVNSLFFVLFARLSQNAFVMLIGAVLFFGLLPFLSRNVPPARLVMGDAGSQLLGLSQAVMAMSLDMAGAGRELRLAIPILIVALPLFDLLFVMVMRIKQRKSIFLKSNDHFVFRMRTAGRADRDILRRMLALCIMTNATAVFIFYLPQLPGALLVIACSAALLAAGMQVGRIGVVR